jgi:hypothetical protein
VLFLCGFTVGFLVVYAFSPLIFKTKICCGAEGHRAGQLRLEFSNLIILKTIAKPILFILGSVSSKLFFLEVQ